MCNDSTHKTNPFGFKLVAVVVPDELKNSKKYLIISSSMGNCSQGIFKAFFNSLNERVPQLKLLLTHS